MIRAKYLSFKRFCSISGIRLIISIFFISVISACSDTDMELPYIDIDVDLLSEIQKNFREEPRVILHQWGSNRAFPQTIADNIQYLEDSRSVFDGAALFLIDDGEPSFNVMTNNIVTYQQCYDAIKPIADLNSETMKYFFAAVYIMRPTDPFDNWDNCINNWANMAKAAKDAGLAGIMFDNEEYFEDQYWLHYPDDCDYPEKSLAEYVEQTRLRGKQIMEAIVGEYPDIIVFTLHGPYASEKNGPSEIYNVGADFRELGGAFFTGMMEGRGDRALVTDGGEMYGLRTEDHFNSVYNWQKIGLGSDYTDCFFIPEHMRNEQWTKNIDISYGLYDSPDLLTGREMNPDIMKTTVANALYRADHFTWIYFEEHDMLSPNPENDIWAEKALEGKMEALNK